MLFVTGPKGDRGPRGTTATNAYFYGVVDTTVTLPVEGDNLPFVAPVLLGTSAITADAAAGTFTVIPGAYLVTISFGLDRTDLPLAGSITLVNVVGPAEINTILYDINDNEVGSVLQYSASFIIRPTATTSYASAIC